MSMHTATGTKKERPGTHARLGSRRRVVEKPEKRHLAAEVARLWVQEKSRKEIRRAMAPWVKSVYEVSRLLRYAKENDILRFVIDENAAAWATQHQLSAELRDELGLLSAHVVTFPSDMHYSEEVDDDIHFQLGLKAASWLRQVVVDNSTILTVGGRTPHYVALGMGSHAEGEPAMTPRMVRVVPITGTIGAGMWSPRAPRGQLHVDADDAAFHFSRAFDAPPIVLGYPGATTDRHRLAEALARQHELIYGPDGQYHPEIAICGVGRLAGGHALVKALRSPMPGHPLTPIMRILGDFLSSSSNGGARKATDLPYGDLANRLFPLGEPTPQEFEMLKRVNHCVIGISMTELAKVPTVLLCAGGEVKYPAIRRVLGFMRPGTSLRLIRVLVTDSRTAERLLKEKWGSLPTIDVSNLPGESEAVSS